MKIDKLALSKAVEINRLHQAFSDGLRTTLQIAIQIGELLIEQKKECGHGNLLKWIEANLSFSRYTAVDYMRCYQKRDTLNVETTPHLTIHDVVRATAKPDKEEVEEKNEIHFAFRGTLQGIIETGKEFINARAALKRGDFQKVIKRSGFSGGSAGRLMAIAKSKIPSIANHALWPTELPTLYELTKLGDNLPLVIDQGQITPELTPQEAKQLCLEYK